MRRASRVTSSARSRKRRCAGCARRSRPSRRELADIERQIADFDARFALASAYNEADYKAYDALKSRYERQMHEWEKASYELELTENG